MSGPEPTAARSPVRISIFGQTYTLVAKGDPGHIERVAAAVDQLMNEVARKTGHGDTLRIAVLACLHFADKLADLEQEVASLKDRVDRGSQQLSILLDEALEDDS